MQKSTKKIFKTLLSLALVLVVTVGGVFGVMAALNTNVKSSFVISYTAHNVNARVIGQYRQGGSPREKFGEDIVFSGEEENATSQGFPNKSFVLDGPNDVLEVYYSIFNNSPEFNFAVVMDVSNLKLTNFDVKYSFLYWSGPSEEAEQAGDYLSGAPAPSFTRTVSPQKIYLTPKGTDTCCALIAMQFRVSDVEQNAKISGNVTFDLDGNADEPFAELFDSQTKQFNKATFDRILQKISGDVSVSAENMALIDQMASAQNDNNIPGSDAQDFRNNNAGKNIVISLGGLTWHVCYLSKAKGENGDNDGDTILTIWLSSSQQEAWDGFVVDEGETYRISAGNLTSQYLQWYNGGSPCNRYGQSYIHAVVLNNGGKYFPSRGSLKDHTPVDTNMFAIFTMEEFGLTPYIVQPQNVSWQESGTINENFINEYWSQSSSQEYVWDEDYIWLPSLTETYGTETNENGNVLANGGIWQTDTAQRKNITSSWLRSGNYSRIVQSVDIGAAGTSYGRTLDVVWFEAIRPALHLNLTKIAEALA